MGFRDVLHPAVEKMKAQDAEYSSAWSGDKPAQQPDTATAAGNAAVASSANQTANAAITAAPLAGGSVVNVAKSALSAAHAANTGASATKAAPHQPMAHPHAASTAAFSKAWHDLA